MRKIVLALFALAAMAACTSIDCPVQNLVYTNYELRQSDGKADTLKTDMLWISTKRIDGTDTVVLNGLYGDAATAFSLPISHSCPEDIFYLTFNTAEGNVYEDTFRIKKEDFPHFESVDCQAAYFHTLTNVSTSHHVVDSIVIKYPKVNYDVTHTHFYIYFKADR